LPSNRYDRVADGPSFTDIGGTIDAL